MGIPVDKWAVLRELSATQGAGKGILTLFAYLGIFFIGLAAVFYLGPPRDPWILMAYMGAALGILISSNGYRGLQRRQLVADTPTSKCRSLAMGFVEVTGRAAGELTTPSLIVQVPCYCSEVKVWRYVKSDRDKESGWKMADANAKGVNFYVEDDTGRVRVNPFEAEFDLTLDFEYDTSEAAQRGRIHDVFRQYCEARGLGWGGPMRFEERNLRTGRPVYVLGTATEISGVQDEQQRILIRKGKHHPWFLIAEASQKDVLQKLGRNTWLYILGGMALTLICLGWFLGRIGML